jgi:ABC-type cobalt transport system substrate-binding protein
MEYIIAAILIFLLLLIHVFIVRQSHKAGYDEATKDMLNEIKRIHEAD